MDITKNTVVELKALWLDQVLIIETAQNNIRAIKQEINKRPKTNPVETKKDKAAKKPKDGKPVDQK